MRRVSAVASQCRRFVDNGRVCFDSLMKSSNERHAIVSHAYSVSCLGFSTHTRVLRQSWAQQKSRQWMCLKTECRSINRAGAANCEACGTAKPVIKGWLCTECQTRNYDGVKKCHKCRSEHGFSKEFWMCVSCEKNNRVDDLDDNSRCGFCGYDMAPMSITEADAQRIANERSERVRDAQQEFDRLSARDAEEQFGDDAAGASALPEAVRQPAAGLAGLKVPEVKPFAPAPFATAHSRIARRRKPLPPPGTPPGPPGFDWMCREAHCGTVNPGDEETCSQCAAHVAPAEWECVHCAAMNHLSRVRCFNCNITIPVSWMCGTCRTATSIYDRTCRHCGGTRPPAEPKEAREVHASSARTMGGGGGKRSRRSDWYCRECQGLNFASRTTCFQCNAARSSAGGAAPMMGGDDAAEMGDTALSHNNWFCRHCQASNFRTRTTCWQCGHTSSESGATAWSEDKDVPQFEREGFQPVTGDERVADGQVNVWDKKTDDWTCGKCFSKNFKNRMECHKCGSKKTVAVAPRRAFVRKPVKI